jgi:hypothetical protein
LKPPGHPIQLDPQPRYPYRVACKVLTYIRLQGQARGAKYKNFKAPDGKVYDSKVKAEKAGFTE